ncbi:hypothetical protein N9Z31_03605 [Pseudomonadales bacterium]|nr:hypothetical protein [Pseudomonadales bacterium]
MAITKLISILSALAFSNMAWGQQVPNTFQPGNPIVASEVNANFDALEAEIAVLKAQVETLQSTSGNALPQYVGVSSGTIDGGQGIRAMTELCHADYPGSRMCMTEEYVKTSNFPTAGAASEAWIGTSSVQIHAFGTYNTNTRFYEPYAGFSTTDKNDLNCSSWQYANYDGLVVSPSGRFLTLGCSTARPVACCK